METDERRSNRKLRMVLWVADKARSSVGCM